MLVAMPGIHVSDVDRHHFDALPSPLVNKLITLLRKSYFLKSPEPAREVL